MTPQLDGNDTQQHGRHSLTRPLLSVVIPTRNRRAYVIHAVRTVQAEYPDAEIVICDNSDEEALAADFANEIAGGRIKYLYTPEMLSVSDNFERALSAASGEYITLLGDDDTVGPHLGRIAQWAKQNGIDAINWRSDARVVHYFWPGVSLPFWGDRVGGSLYLSNFTGKTQLIDPRRGIADAIRHLGAGPRSLPRAYLGMVSSGVVERVRARWGRVFEGLSPDVHAGVLVALEARRQVVIDYPFLIPGACPKSNSILHAEQPAAEIGKQEHLQRYMSINWDERVPGFYSHLTVWALALVDVTRRTGIPLSTTAFPFLYATCLLKGWSKRELIFSSMAAYAKSRGFTTTYALVALCLIGVSARRAQQIVKSLWRGKPGGALYCYDNLKDTDAAHHALVDHLTERSVDLKLPPYP